MDADGADELEPGKLIDGRYRLERVAGRGAFGVVYEAHHIALDSRVAIKVMRVADSAPPRPARVAQFLSEARTSSSLRHPAIVRVLDAGVLDGKPYFVMEWCDGPTLKAIIAERGAMSAGDAWALLEPVFDAIAFAHGKGVVHRDIKPSNVVMFEGSLRVIDFGIAKLVGPDETPGGGDTTTIGQSPFTPSYASPEQLAGTRTGPWTDVYALALLLLEVITGNAAGPTPKGFGGQVGPLEAVLTRALAVRPADRFPDAGEFAKAVREALAPRRRPWVFFAVPALALAIVGGVLVARVLPANVPEPRADSGAELVASNAVTDASVAALVPSGAPSVAVSLPAPVASLSDAAVATNATRNHPSPTANASTTGASVPTVSFEVNGYENGGLGQSNPVPEILRVAATTKTCFPDPTGDDVWNVFAVFQWPKGKPRELKLEVRRDREITQGPTADTIAACVRAKFEAATIPTPDGQDDLPTHTSYEKVDMGYFRHTIGH